MHCDLTRSKLDREVGNSIAVEVGFQLLLSVVKTQLSRCSTEVGSVYEMGAEAAQIDFVKASLKVYD